MSKYVNISELVDYQKVERYKGLLILGNLTNLKPSIGRKLSDKLKGTYINLVYEFAKESRLNKIIDVFDCDDLKGLLKNYNNGSDVVIIEGLDMLWTIWSQYEKERFLKMFEKNTISPFKETVNIFLCLKDDKLSQQNLTNNNNQNRILQIDEIILGGE